MEVTENSKSCVACLLLSKLHKYAELQIKGTKYKLKETNRMI